MKIIEDMYDHGRKLELFSRKPRQGWDADGNEADAGLLLAAASITGLGDRESPASRLGLPRVRQALEAAHQCGKCRVNETQMAARGLTVRHR